ncbi:methyltransferase [uncultured Bifidobacterium sp.]|uniref:class I SAM-dependent methyltransferase n=1 Tax=uncultured Bifidobacterium sp. TaxID=165187 RepID=UPI0028DB629E|nr:methyltransferase [uncultured Bifidobacterium sp.]
MAQGDGGEQYFSSSPESPDVRRSLHLELRGRDVTVETSNGVFSAHRLDLGTSVLLRHAPEPPLRGTLLDLGCGWGPLSLTMALESPEASVWAVDVNERAVELTARNAASNSAPNVHAVLADAVPEDLRFDLIWSNPPIRVGKEALHALLMSWLPRLNPSGTAYLVVQRNLGSDSLLAWLSSALPSFACSKYASSKGYRVIEVRRTA